MKGPGVYIIAEAGVNHNGSLETALRLVDTAAGAGADAVKFQTFTAESLATESAPKAQYQNAGTGVSETQFEMLRKLELKREYHPVLMDRCHEKGIEFLSTPFDNSSLHFLSRVLGLETIKLSSGEVTNGPLLLEAARYGSKVILSTGMSTLHEVEEALGVLAFGYSKDKSIPSRESFRESFLSTEGQAWLRKKVTLLHCTTEYPAPFAEVNLRAMHALRDAFGLPVGYSDHTTGIAVSVAAVALGAMVIEKHFTLDRNLPGPDHRASLEPAELKLLVESIRQVEQALGAKDKKPTPSEMKNRIVVRKSLVAAREIRAGEKFTADSLSVKRPGEGVSPMEYWSCLGCISDKNYGPGDSICSTNH